MKINELVREIKAGKHDAGDGYVKLPKEDMVNLLMELHKRRKVMSRPK